MYIINDLVSVKSQDIGKKYKESIKNERSITLLSDFRQLIRQAIYL